jgi:ABC-type glycerol-3-phosphate transport system substrate-binding protein
MQPKAQYLFLIILLVLAQILAACSPKSPASPTTAPSVEQIAITFACSEWERQAYERLAERFHQTHPHVEVQVLSRQKILGGDMGREDAIRKLAASADTFAYPSDLLTRHTREGLVKDLSPFIEADSTFEAADFYPGLLEQFQWDGGTWALPAKVYPALIFYDQTAFEEAGLSPPRPGWTYEEFTQAAQQLTVREGERILRYGFINPSPDLALPLVLGRAGAWADESVAPPLPELDNPALAEAVEWYTDLALKHGVMPNPAEFDQQELMALIEDRKAAMWVWYPTMHLEPGVVSPPEEKAIVNWKWASGYAVSAGTSHPQEAWEWLFFLTHQPLETGMESVSPRRSLSGQELDEGMKEVYDYVLNKPQVTLPADLPVVDPILEALDSVFAGERGVDEALAEAQAQALALVQASAEEGHTLPSPIVVATPRPQDEGGAIAFCADGGNLKYYQPLVEEFHEQHPQINVDLKLIEWVGNRPQTEGCDCFITHSGFGVAPSLDYQRFLSLQPFIDADPDFNLDDFYPQFLERFRREGDLWGLPFEGELQVLLYNKDLFDEAGVEYPQPGWTLEDFLEKAVALTNGKGESKVYGYMPFDSDMILLLPGLETATLVDARAQPPRPQLDNPTVVAALRWYTDLTLVYDVMPVLTKEEFRQDPHQSILERQALISANRVAMWSTHPTTGIPFMPPRVGVVPPPLGQRKMGMRENGVLGYVISADATHPQACWEWIKFASDRSAVVTRGLPARRSIAESPSFRSQVGEEVADALLYTVEHIDPSLDALEQEHPWLIVLVYWVIEAHDRVLEGADVEEALSKAQAKAEALVNCLGEDIASADRAQYWICAQEVDPEVEIPPDLRRE